VKDFDLEEKEQALLQSQVRNQQLIIIFLCLLLLGATISLYFIVKNVRRRRQANQLLLLKSLRTQMNPHFIFNALNSVNNFISRNDERAANKFLSNFARLMRMVLDHSQKDFISFEEEVDLLELYLELEHFRFRDKFDYTFEKSPDIDYAAIDLPPMLLQPFVENAIWHGL
ncbi:MAG: histidine kinase, partial [Saprospiraceae bacterium]|nr:histidine kinase [Saprospiraceae bacterium]